MNVAEVKYGLKTSTIDQINQVFSTYPQIEQVIIYGSRAKGNFHNGSDIDLTIKGESLSPSHLMQIESKLDDLLLPYKFDLSQIHKIDNPELLDHIKRVGKTFYQKSLD